MGIEFTLHPGQQIVMRSKARFTVAVTGVQAGKTTCGALWLLGKIYESYEAGVRTDWLIAAPTVKILQQSTLPKFREFFPRDWGEWKENRQCFDLAWGNHIYVRSTEEPDHIEGMTVGGAWLDEMGQMKEQAWVNVQGRLAIHRGPLLGTTTPYTMGWFWREVVQAAGLRNEEVVDGPGKSKDIHVVSWVSSDNPAFPMDEMERARASLPEAVFERRYMGKFTRLEGLVYPDFDDDNIVRSFTIPGEWERFAGIDFGHTNPTAVVCVAKKPEIQADPSKGIAHEPSVFYVYREFYLRNALLHQVADFLKQEPLAYALGDPRGAQEIAELSRYFGVKRVMPADNKVEIGVERIASLIKEKRLKFIRGRADNTIGELETYHYPAMSFDKAVNDKPVAVNNHAMDALKYAFSRQVDGMYRGMKKRPAISRVKNIFSRTSMMQTLSADKYTGY